jgi:osmotically-inducible protein OsmY
MSFLSNLFGAKFDDSQLVSQATKAIASDPLISDATSLVVTSKKGVITLDGIVSSTQEKDRIEGAVRNALRGSGLKYESIVNDLKRGQR